MLLQHILSLERVVSTLLFLVNTDFHISTSFSLFFDGQEMMTYIFAILFWQWPLQFLSCVGMGLPLLMLVYQWWL